MKQKINVRLSLFIIIIILLPLTFIIKSPYDYYLTYKKPLVTERGDSYRICTVTGCSQFPRKIIDDPKYSSSDFDIESGQYLNTVQGSLDDPDFNFSHFTITNQYYQKLNSAKFERNNSKESFYFYISICSVYLFAFLFVWLKNKIIFIDDIIKVKSLWLKKASFNIDSIEVINIITTTPLIAKRTGIDQINWRDAVGIYYRGSIGHINNIAVPLFIFPGFKKIVKEIIRKKPNVKIFFGKRTLEEILKENITG